MMGRVSSGGSISEPERVGVRYGFRSEAPPGVFGSNLRMPLGHKREVGSDGNFTVKRRP